ncbi:MAG: sugar ABC transporter permease [Chloroflexia bacterium]
MATQTSARGASGSGPSSSWYWRNQRRLAPYLFISPFFILFIVFGLYPILYSFWLSFYKGFGFEEKTFFGLGNYAYLLGDERYIKSVRNTTQYALGSLFILSPLALLLALAINSRYVKWKGLYKTAFFFPVITSAVVITIIFSRVLDKQYGILNLGLDYLKPGAGFGPFGWLEDPQIVMISFIVMGIWTYTGINMLYWLAGLTGISKDFYEAAEVDGANKVQSFRFITLPLLRPVTLFVAIQAIVGSYGLFAQPLLLTEGGPSDASLTVTLYLYQQGFVYFNVGYASAIAYSMVLLLLVLSIINIVVFQGYNTD